MDIEKVKRECYEIKIEYYPPDYPSAICIYSDMIQKCLNNDLKILNVGCGKGKENILYKSISNLSVGIDVKRDDLMKNKLHDYLVNANMENLPFKSQYFDLIISKDVFEHLKNPHTVFNEFNRILKAGGRIIFLTPNVWGYASIISKFTPFEFHLFFKKLLGEDISDFFPTFYRANSRRALKKICKSTGFKIKEMITFQKWPAALIFSKTLFRLGILYERLVNKYNLFSSIRSVIIASFEKTT